MIRLQIGVNYLNQRPARETQRRRRAEGIGRQT
jgi:hypothetical protein